MNCLSLPGGFELLQLTASRAIAPDTSIQVRLSTDPSAHPRDLADGVPDSTIRPSAETRSCVRGQDPVFQRFTQTVSSLCECAMGRPSGPHVSNVVAAAQHQCGCAHQGVRLVFDQDRPATFSPLPAVILASEASRGSASRIEWTRLEPSKVGSVRATPGLLRNHTRNFTHQTC
jgi:hypothetical protein